MKSGLVQRRTFLTFWRVIPCRTPRISSGGCPCAAVCPLTRSQLISFCTGAADSVATSVPLWTGSVSPEAISVSFSEGAPLQAAKVMQLMKAMTLLIEFLPLFDATDISSFDDDGLSRGFKE